MTFQKVHSSGLEDRPEVVIIVTILGVSYQITPEVKGGIRVAKFNDPSGTLTSIIPVSQSVLIIK